jgi:hypothetical protein
MSLVISNDAFAAGAQFVLSNSGVSPISTKKDAVMDSAKAGLRSAAARQANQTAVVQANIPAMVGPVHRKFVLAGLLASLEQMMMKTDIQKAAFKGLEGVLVDWAGTKIAEASRMAGRRLL